MIIIKVVFLPLARRFSGIAVVRSRSFILIPWYEYRFHPSHSTFRSLQSALHSFLPEIYISVSVLWVRLRNFFIWGLFPTSWLWSSVPKFCSVRLEDWRIVIFIDGFFLHWFLSWIIVFICALRLFWFRGSWSYDEGWLTFMWLFRWNAHAKMFSFEVALHRYFGWDI